MWGVEEEHNMACSWHNSIDIDRCDGRKRAVTLKSVTQPSQALAHLKHRPEDTKKQNMFQKAK